MNATADAPPAPGDEAAFQRRQAWLAYTRQKLLAPAEYLLACSRELLTDARQLAPEDFCAEVAKVVNRSEHLVANVGRMLDLSGAEGGPPKDTSEFERSLRHDLRSPAAFVISTCDLLREEAPQRLLDKFLPDLDALTQTASRVIEQIGNLILFALASDQPDAVDPEGAGIAAAVARNLRAGRRHADDEAGRLLVVDDDEASCELLRRMLAKPDYGGHAVTTAAGGEEALNLLAANPAGFDVILLDVMMPGLNGFEVLERLKADEALRHLPVIMVSALSEEEGVAGCITRGAEDYLIRPIRPQLLRARISASLEKKRLRDREMGLLRAIFPPQVVAEYQRTGDVRAARYDNVGVLFLDIVGFTSRSERLPPEQVMDLLRRLVGEFEAAADRHGALKIKTIGDAFMCTANLLAADPDPVLTLLHCGLDMAAAAGRHTAPGPDGREEPVRVRIGLHVGPVVAGKLGDRQFSFDLWGATVNLASRMESSGLPGRITLSPTAYEVVRTRCRCEPREVHVRSLSKMQVWDFVEWTP